MAGDFGFAIRRADLPRVNALRLAMGADFWPAAAFAVFDAARRCDPLAFDTLAPAVIDAALTAAKSRGFARLLPMAVRVQQENADPEVVAYLELVQKRHGLPSARVAALAILAEWAADPAGWRGGDLFAELAGLRVAA